MTKSKTSVAALTPSAACVPIIVGRTLPTEIQRIVTYSWRIEIAALE